MDDGLRTSVVVASRLEKYDVGVDPKTGEPFEVLESTDTLVGQEAVDFLKSNNIQVITK